MKQHKYKVIDLFSGCGGMSLGFEMSGFETVIAIDNWNDALVTFKYNHKDAKTLCADLNIVDPLIIKNEFTDGDIDVIIGGPPCQGFSIAGKREVEDERNKLYKSFVNFVRAFSPQAFVMENVPNILSIGGGSVRDSIVRDFEALGYNVSYKVLIASDYGVPQSRKRAVFVGLKIGTYDFPKPHSETPISSYEALSDLPGESIEDGSNYPVEAMSNYQTRMREGCKGLYNHQITQHSDKTVEIIGMVPDGGNYKDLPEELWSTRKVNIAWTRLNSKKPSFTIDTGHRHHFHYKYNRVPTVREAARIQSFPDSFIFLGSKTSQYKQVGNAVPPLMAKAIASNLLKYMSDV